MVSRNAAFVAVTVSLLFLYGCDRKEPPADTQPSRSDSGKVSDDGGVDQLHRRLLVDLESSDLRVRVQAAQRLCHVNPDRLVGPLTEVLLEARDSRARMEAAECLGRLGAAGKPVAKVLIKAIRTENDRGVTDALDEALGRVSPPSWQVVDALIGAAKSRDWYAGDGIKRGLIAQGKTAVPALLEAFRKKSSCFFARDVLREMGFDARDALPTLVALLADSDGQVSSEAAQTLMELGPVTAEAVDRLIVVLSDKSAGARRLAADVLASIGPLAEKAVPALAKALQDDDWQVQDNAAHALGRIGPAAVPALVEALRDNRAQVRKKACEALGQIDPLTDAVIPALITALNDSDDEVCNEAVKVLEKIGPVTDAVIPALINAPKGSGFYGGLYARSFHWSSRQIIPALIRALRHPNVVVRRRAARVLSLRDYARRRQVADALLSALEDEDAGVRHNAACALESVGTTRVVMALLKATEDKDAHAREGARTALGRIKPEQPGEIVPALIKALREGGPDARIAAADALATLGPAAKPAVADLTRALIDNEKEVRWNAAYALGEIGPAAKPAVAALVRALGEKRLRQTCTVALIRIDPTTKEILPVLIDALTGNGGEQRWAAEVLTGMRAHAAPALPALLKAALETNDDYVLKPVLKALAAIGKPTDKIVPAIAKLTHDKDHSIGELAARSLGQFGPAGRRALLDVLAAENYWVAREAADTLKEAGAEAVALLRTQGLRHSSPIVRVKSVEILGQLGKLTKPAIPDLIRSLSDSDAKVRRQAVKALALGEMGPSDAPAVAALIKVLKDDDTKARAAALYALSKIGPAAKEAYPTLLAMMNRPDVTGESAAYTLSKIVAGDDTVVPDLVKLLGSNDAYVRRRALKVLAAVGPKAKAAEGDIVKLLGNNDSNERLVALVALSKINPSSPCIIPRLLKLFHDRHWYIRINVFQTLGEMGQSAGSALPDIQVAARFESGYGRVAAFKAILQIDPANTEALADLVRETRSSDRSVRGLAWSALGEIGERAVPIIIEMVRGDKSISIYQAARSIGGMGPKAVPPLVEALKSPHKRDRRLAVQALGKLWHVAGPAVPNLVAAMKDPDHEVRTEAVAALINIKSKSKPAIAVPAMLVALKDPHPDVRASAAKALGYLASSDKTVMAALTPLLTDRYREVRSAAADALNTIEWKSNELRGQAGVWRRDYLLTSLQYSGRAVR